MILAAGLGTRLRPLTFVTPKPLLRIGRTTLIERNLRLLKKAGIRHVVINLHHLGGMIREKLGNGKRYGLKISYTSEKKILGTGGGIKNAEKFLKGGAFFVINADSLHNVNLRSAIRSHLKSKAPATMVIRRIARGEKYTKIDVDADGFLKTFGRGRYMFTGVSILEPVIFRYLKKPSCLIKSGFKMLKGRGLKISTFNYRGYFNDVGTPERYKAAGKKLRSGML
jgi:NDP-sugar pyrophosphorylase family protein